MCDAGTRQALRMFRVHLVEVIQKDVDSLADRERNFYVFSRVLDNLYGAWQAVGGDAGQAVGDTEVCDHHHQAPSCAGRAVHHATHVY